MKTVPEGDCSPIILVPNTKWVIGSGFTDQVITQNYLHLFDSETETGAAVQPFEIAIRPRIKPIGRNLRFIRGIRGSTIFQIFLKSRSSKD